MSSLGLRGIETETDLLSIASLKLDKIYIPPFKTNHKENAYFARLDKGKISDLDTDVTKPKCKPIEI